MRSALNLLCGVCVLMCVTFTPSHSYAQNSDPEFNQRLSIARQFVNKIKAGFNRVDGQMNVSAASKEENYLPDGEQLLLQPVLGRYTRVEGVVFSFVENGKPLISLRDFTEVLRLAIDLDAEQGTAQGWYIREDRLFNLNFDDKIVSTHAGEFVVSDQVQKRDNDIWVPISELANWFDFKIDLSISSQEIHVDSDIPLPLEGRKLRRKNKVRSYEVAKPQLPLGGEDYQAADIPVVDVSTNSTYVDRPDGKSVSKHNAVVVTTGDLGYGTLRTQSRLNDEDGFVSALVNYKRESTEAELLGPLKARRYEVGDVSTVNVPLGGRVSQELGARVTNTDSLRNFSKTTTGVSGSAIPGWDVELYRESQLIGFQQVGDDGFYSFDDVELFLNDNNFRLVFYGPQGEIREESVYVPVDRDVLARGEGIYDVSVSMNNRNTYVKDTGNNAFDDEDDDSINVSALYERPLANGVSGQVGLRSYEEDGERNTVGNVGVSATVSQTLLNADLAVDDEGDVNTKVTARRNFGDHEVRADIQMQAAEFDVQGTGIGFGGGDLDGLGNSNTAYRAGGSVSGPIQMPEGLRARYGVASDYMWDGDDSSLSSNLSLSAGWRNFTVGNSFVYTDSSNATDATLRSTSNFSGSFRRNRFRLTSDYEIKPDNELRSILATYRRDISKKLDVELGVEKRYQQSLVEYQAKLDWQAGFARITPRITYDSEDEFFAGISTRFAVIKDPSTGKVRMLDQNLSNFGSLSAFVFLDKDGDGEFNGEDEPLKDVVVSAPQNGRRQTTDENGVALFSRMLKLRLTDVFLEKDTLQDPVWIPGFEGVSILPREGYVANVNFPVHMSGELDGVVYAQKAGEAAPVPVRNIPLALYNDQGELEKKVSSDGSGFYYFAQIPPGRYLLVIDSDAAQAKNLIRPQPQKIEIGYDGTVIYGNDLYMDVGEGDVPSVVLSDLDDYKAMYPDINFDEDYELVLNLGEYNSRLLMSVIWFKLRSRYSSLLAGGDLFVPPTKSRINEATGKHILRVGLKGDDMSDAYARCRSFIARDQYCKVEIYPAVMKQALAEQIAVE